MSNELLNLPPKAYNKFCRNASGRPAKYCYGILIFIYIFPYNSRPGNEELNRLDGNKNKINHIRAQRLAWFGQVHRMPDSSMVSK